MIKHTVYFRTEEDFERFKAIKNKTEWLHEQLDMPKATVDGYRSEHFFSVKVDPNMPENTAIIFDESKLQYTPPENVA